MDFDEYRQFGRSTYAALVDRIKQVLASGAQVHGLIPYAISGRAKEPDSLLKKLQDRDIDPTSAIDELVKDLAGVRVIFLTNGQVQRFLSTGVIGENFDIISVNVHHAVPGTETETKLFSSTNYFVQFKPSLLEHTDYSAFVGLKAEIQVQTLLNHAWAEMNHDTFYKAPEFRYVDRAQFDRIKARMDAVMREHLLPAGHDFDKVARDIALLMKAEEAFEPAATTIRMSSNNDEIASALETFDDVVLPHLAERRDRFLDLLPDLVAAVDRVRATRATKIDTVLGQYDGASGEDVARKFASLLHHHRYCDPEQTLQTLLHMYSAASVSERKLWRDQGAQFAEHDRQVWLTHGPANQGIIVDGIRKLDPPSLRQAQGLILGMLEKVLSSEVGGASRGEELNTLQIHRGTVAPSEALKQIRADAMSILEHMVGSAADDAERSVILQTLRQASRPPYHGGNAALRTIVMEDARRVVVIEQTVASNSGLEVRRQMEVHALDVHYWYGEVPRDMASDAALVAAQKRLISELLKLRDHLNDDQDYVLYKLLIGHDSVRPGAWTGEHYEPKATDSWREAAWPEILNLVDAEGAAAWTARMRRYLAIRPEPGAGFPLLNFSQHLGQVRPEVALHLLGDMDDTLSMLLLSLLIGLDRAGRTSDALAAVNAWISQGRFLTIMADWLATHAKPDTGRLMAVAGRACELDDHQAAITSANAAAKLWDKLHDQRLIEDVFLPCVAHLAAAGQTNWLRHAWDVRQGGLVDALDENQTKSFLASFVDAETIEYDSDRILAAVAVRRPELVLDFFEERLRRLRRDHAGRFDAIPFRLHELPKALSRYPNLLVSATRRWFDFDPQLHQFLGGRLFANVFSTLTDDVISQLRALIAAGDKDDLAFVLATLRPYEGREEIYPICMDVVDRLPAGDKLLQHVSEVLSETGVVSGEFGFVEAEGKLYELLGRYVDDPRANVRAFAQDTRRRTEQSMAWEQRRAEQELEQMRRDWA